MSDEITARNRAIAIEAITGVFIKRDTDVPQKLFNMNYTNTTLQLRMAASLSLS